MFKYPKQIDFATEPLHAATGKLQNFKPCKPYWARRAGQVT
jgi:hypothetical protein